MAETKPSPNQKLRYERERRGWSQQDVADKVGTTPLNVGRWERGVTLPGPHFRQQLSEVFEKTLQELGLAPANTNAEKVSEVLLSVPVMAAAQDTPTTLWNVPYNRNLLFTGREDILSLLRDGLTSEDHPVALAQPQAISGLGGIGKTQTAVEYAYRYRESYEGIFWARADSAELLTSDFLTLAALLNLPQRNEQDQNVIVNAVKQWFDTHEGWLLILDNADQLEVVNEFMPSAGKGHVLLTTRAHSTGTIAQRIEIEKMGTDEGIILLLRRMKRLKGSAGLESVPESVRRQAQAIVEALDGLPLALDQAGAYIEETGCSLSDYLKFYQSRRKRLLRTRGQSATGHPEPVATTWSLAFEKVEAANPAAAELLRLCAFLHPDEIPESMLIEGASELGPVLLPVAKDEMELNEAIGELRKYSLVKRDPELKILNVHRLVQAVIKDGMDEQIQKQWAERVVHMMAIVFPKPSALNRESEEWAKCQRFFQHMMIGTELIKQWHLQSPQAALVLNLVGTYLGERAQLKDVEGFWKQALAIREQTLPPDHPDIAESLHYLAGLYSDLGKYQQAEELFLRSLTMREKAFGETHLDVAESLNDLAGLCWHLQKYEQAVTLLRRSLAIREQLLEPTHPDVALSLGNLAVIYDLQGKYELSEPLHKQALAIREQVLGPNHPYVALNLQNLGFLYTQQGKYEQAEPFLTQALTIRERVLEADHPSLAESLHNLASLYQRQGKGNEAEPLFKRAIAIREKVFGELHLHTAQTMANLAKLYAQQERYTEAEALFLKSITAREQSLGEEHPQVTNTLNAYADLLRKMNRDTEAIALESRVKAIQAQ